MGKQVEVICSYCGNLFLRPRNRYNEAVRNGGNQFCSRECQNQFQDTKETVSCNHCGTPIKIHRGLIAKSKTGRFFCSHTCSASETNKGRIHTEATRKKIQEKNSRGPVIRKLPNHEERPCMVCGKPFSSRDNDVKACSKVCGQILQHGVLPLTKEEVITQIQALVGQLGHTPSSKQVTHSLTHAAARFFGSWNKAMISLGFEPNTQWMSKKKLICKDGHKADSLAERILDDWFYEQGVQHERAKRYPDSRLNCDFYLTEYDIWVEYFGLWQQHPRYDQTVLEKYARAKTHGINLIGISPEMMFPCITFTLEDILEGRLQPLVPIINEVVADPVDDDFDFWSR